MKIHDTLLTFLLAAALLFGGAILYKGTWSAEPLPVQWAEGDPCGEDEDDEDDTTNPADNMPAGFGG